MVRFPRGEGHTKEKLLMKTQTYKDIFNINIKYLDYLISKSFLSHQYLGNIPESGSQVESELRSIFSKILPKRYKVTHGYIASATNSSEEPLISPQLDMIIVDTLVPQSLFILDSELSLELVPIESVVAIFEIKRTLNKSSFTKALNHLFETQQKLNLKKNNKSLYFPTGVNGIGSLYSNPLIGILSITHEKKSDLDNYKSEFLDVFEDLLKQNKAPDLDICSCLGAFFIGTCDNTGKNFWTYPLRDENKKYSYLFKIHPKLDNPLEDRLSEAYFLSITLGYVQYYISQITGRMANLENYYFNKTI